MSRPILFSGPMVRALLDGRKTVTRRVVKPQPKEPAPGFGWDAIRYFSCVDRWCWSRQYESCISETDHGYVRAAEVDDYQYHRCPYGRPGDRLWVRETWATEAHYDDLSPRDIGHDLGTHDLTPVLWYAADWGLPVVAERGRRRPSIHMPRWASRITLEVEDVRVERVQDITPADLAYEGCPGDVGPPDGDIGAMAEWFTRLWNDLNAKRGHSWEDNPWVWRVQFRAVADE